MSQPDPKLLEDLSAWMDGELPPDQARFLERRLAGDPALRAQLERWQLAAASLRGQPVRLMPASMADDVAAAIAGESRPARSRWRWATGAAAAALALALLPGLLEMGSPPRLPPADPGLAARPAPPALEASPVAPVSPVPAEGLALGGEPVARPWPRSPVARDPGAIESYLVRHNALMASEGQGGFLPYVDVVAHDERADAAPAPEPEPR